MLLGPKMKVNSGMAAWCERTGSRQREEGKEKGRERGQCKTGQRGYVPKNANTMPSAARAVLASACWAPNGAKARAPIETKRISCTEIVAGLGWLGL